MSLLQLLERRAKDPESWRYTDLEKLIGPFFATPSDPALVHPLPLAEISAGALPSLVEDPSQRRQIVFVNGMWRADLSHLGALPKGVMDGCDGNEYRLTLEGETCLITTPIELIFLSTPREAPRETTTKLRVSVGRSGRLTLIEHHMGSTVSSETIASLIETDIRLAPQSKIMHGKILHNEGGLAHLATTKVHVDEGAYYRNFVVVKGRKLVRNEIDVTLAGKLSQCALYGVMLLRGREHADCVTRIHHLAPHGTSDQLYKSVVKDQARGVFQGKIKVAEGAQKTDGRQLSRALLLSDQAEMDAKPELEIYADDVKCSHGSTVGDLDVDTLFYLRSRGLNEREARAMLLRAFVDDVADALHEAQSRDYVREMTGRWLDEQD